MIRFVVFVIILICIVAGSVVAGSFPRTTVAPLTLPPKTVHLRPILRRYDQLAPPKRQNVAFSSEIAVRTIDKRGRIRDRVGLINDMKRPRVPRSQGDAYPAAPPTG